MTTAYDRKKAKPNSGMFSKGHPDLVPKASRVRAGKKNSGANNVMFGKHLSSSTKEALRKANIGKKISVEQRKAISLANKGKVMSESTRIKISVAQRGEKGNNWKGGKQRSRHNGDWKYSHWRNEVFKRDGYKCVIGGSLHGNKLEAHHLVSWSEDELLRYVVGNGVTLCTECHKKTNNYGGKRHGTA